MKRRLLIVAITGVLLIAAVVLIPSRGVDGSNEGGDEACLASRIGLPCR